MVEVNLTPATQLKVNSQEAEVLIEMLLTLNVLKAQLVKNLEAIVQVPGAHEVANGLDQVVLQEATIHLLLVHRVANTLAQGVLQAATALALAVHREVLIQVLEVLRVVTDLAQPALKEVTALVLEAPKEAIIQVQEVQKGVSVQVLLVLIVRDLVVLKVATNLVVL